MLSGISTYQGAGFFSRAVFLGFCAILASCGPREIGRSDIQPDTPVQATAVEQMRMPITGASSTQRMLYYINQPDVMEQTAKLRTERYRQRLGLAPAPEDPAYREIPRKRSPFRQ